uniref:Trypsin-like serine protease n=1 Tax=Dugesia japonica TaxID=6161 RepID=H2DRI7_DUGJA|nr:trypsin-like serine protease [Dugesia japonica]
MKSWNLNTFKYYQMEVYLAEYDLYRMYGVEKIFQVTKTIIHPSYRHEYAYLEGNDVALIKFDGFISNGQYDYIHYNELDVNAIFKPGDRCEVVGWGSMLPPGQDISRFLQKAAINIISNSECGRIFSNVADVRSNICAGSGRLSTSSCRGDSGGPLFCTDGKRHHIQVGIVSYGTVPCGQPNIPSVYTRVSEVAGWIKANAN